MRIAFLNPQGNFDPAGSYLGGHPNFGGQLVYVREVALALAAMGHKADILTRRIQDPKWPEFAAAQDAYPGQPAVRLLRFLCGPDRFLPKEELWPYLREWAGRIAAWYRAEGIRPDVWSGHYADGGLAAAMLRECSGVPFTFTAHSLGAWKLDGLLRSAGAAPERLAELDGRYNFGARIAAERASMAGAAAIVVSGAQDRYRSYGHPAYRGAVPVEDDRRFAVIPPGIDLAIFSPNGSGPREGEVRDAIRAALDRDIPPARRALPPVVAWSRLDPKKNHLGLVRAFATSAELRERANLVVITRGLDDPLRTPGAASPAEQEVLRPLVAEIEQAGLWGCVSAFHLAGQEAVAALYRWAAGVGGVFCLPATYEPFGLSLIEAMACGLPVVATRNGGPREITEEGEAGVLADPDDPAELGARLLGLMRDRDSWRRYADRGRARAAGRYSWSRAAQGYAALAEEIVRGVRPAGSPPPPPGFIARGTALPRLEKWERADDARFLAEV